MSVGSALKFLRRGRILSNGRRHGRPRHGTWWLSKGLLKNGSCQIRRYTKTSPAQASQSRNARLKREEENLGGSVFDTRAFFQVRLHPTSAGIVFKLEMFIVQYKNTSLWHDLCACCAFQFIANFRDHCDKAVRFSRRHNCFAACVGSEI